MGTLGQDVHRGIRCQARGDGECFTSDGMAGRAEREKSSSTLSIIGLNSTNRDHSDFCPYTFIRGST